MVDFQERDTRRDAGGSSSSGRGGDGDDAGDTVASDDGPDDHGHHDHGDDGDHGHGTHDAHDHEHHDHHRHDVETLGVGVVTVSTTRSLDSDPSGDAIADAFEAEGHEVATRELIPDDYDRIQDVVDTLVGRDDVDVVVTTGGTGVTPDDVTIEAVSPLFGKALPGFGELFRRRSEDQIGTRTIATRTTAGVVDGVLVFCLPGSEAAVELATSDIVLPEAGHLAGLARRDEDDAEE